MKINLSRQNIYLLLLCVFLLIFVFVFSFAVLIPEGKKYRIKRTDYKKETLELKQLSDFSMEKEAILQKLKSDNLHVIKAFGTEFNSDRFEKQHRDFFTSLHVSKKRELESEEGYSVYEVNTTSEISSPKSFYDFLNAINKSNWIIAVNFPINFKRESEMISSSFTMKVYNNLRDSNSTK